jgi:uncharacterized protein YjbI with pentapeptide repeats
MDANYVVKSYSSRGAQAKLVALRATMSAGVGQIRARSELSALRKPSQSELEILLSEHAAWVRSGHNQGQCAQVDNLSFDGMDFSNSCLDGASFSNCLFNNCNLSNTSLQNSTLKRSTFSGTVFTNCTMQGADLTDADLVLAVDLTASQLARTILTGAKLPESISAFENLAYADKLSQANQKLTTGLTLMIAYCWLTVANTQDVAAFTAGNAAELPIIKTTVPLVAVYAGAPVLLIATYLYIHIYLQRLWEALCGLPYVFPDGIPLRQRIDPWILNGFVAEHLLPSKRNLRPLSRIQRTISSLIAWWLAPLTIGLMWVRYLRRQDFIVSCVQALAFAVAVLAAIYLYRLARNTLLYRGTRPASTALVSGKEKLVAVCYGLAVLCFALSGTIVFRDMPSIPGLTVVHFEGSDLSTGVDKNITGMQKPTVAGAVLNELSLQHLQAQAAYLVYAELNNSDLRDANLNQAVLQHTKAVGANFTGAQLWNADIRNADLTDAKLDRANLRNADLRGSNLLRSNLHDADLSYANLKGTKVSANLENAKLIGANFTENGGLPYSNLDHAILRHAYLSFADLSYAIARNAIFIDADLSGADLTETDLREAQLQWANLQGANLTRAELSGANMSDVRNLEPEQIDLAFIDEKTICPDAVKIHCNEIVKRLSSSAAVTIH